jgi:hypothetical protein
VDFGSSATIFICASNEEVAAMLAEGDLDEKLFENE